ncbi:cell division ATP-binding protein FtsE [Candidatus Shapirobacteria bacterium CG_4_10_14_3_um_filter_35_13]|uniref:Cell division ATP-binding protein FtsE n=1 Tax=Candidatus Shapirobacteria bacterium CG_4_10_14_3_um_filter_35_13 TaxID=1974873 RepID=A0A2M7LJ32_9BACT|nr:MAG: cell division ATP-binding protein FtsE [Candidatus Shapirobacteria bacterium CG_4_10_14_3_um_filter_35_13]
MEIKFDSVTKNYGPISAIKDLSFTVTQGDFVFITGPSGSGKSTIIKLILNQIKPSSGQILVNNHSPKTQLEIDQNRRKIGVIFQDFQMITDLTIEENIALNLDIVDFENDQRLLAIDTALKKMKLQNRRFLFPSQLSGGELQRACLARAIAISPQLILADEPTGNLDPINAWNLIKYLKQENEKRGTTIIMTTHHLDIVKSLNKKVIKLIKDN